jgi:hypothetical protein
MASDREVLIEATLFPSRWQPLPNRVMSELPVTRAQFHEAPVKRLWLRHFDESPTTSSSRCASLAPPDGSGIHGLSHGLLFSITAKPDSLG